MKKSLLGMLIFTQMLIFNVTASPASEVKFEINNCNSKPPIIDNSLMGCKIPNKIIQSSSDYSSSSPITDFISGAVGAVILTGEKILDHYNYAAKYDIIGHFNVTNPRSNYEINSSIAKSLNDKNLSLTAISKFKNNDINTNFKQVAFVEDNDKKSEHMFEKVFYIAESEIINKTLHLYSVTLPQELLNSSKNLIVNVSLLSKHQLDDTSGASFENLNSGLDFRLFKNLNDNSIAKTFVLKKSNHFNEIKTSCANQTKQDSNVTLIQKQLKLNMANLNKPIILAVSDLNESIKNEKNSTKRSYAIIIKVNSIDLPQM